MKTHGKKYNVVIMDPSWCANLYVPYETMSDEDIINLPIEEVQDKGYVVLWTLPSKLLVSMAFFAKHGY